MELVVVIDIKGFVGIFFEFGGVVDGFEEWEKVLDIYGGEIGWGGLRIVVEDVEIVFVMWRK